MFGLSRRNTLPIRLYGDPCLGVKAKPVSAIDHETHRTGQILIDTMYEGDGVGLAATQVGIPLRMVALCVSAPRAEDGVPPLPMSPGEIELLPKMPFVIVNPEIVSYGKALELREEGCLSVPDIYAPVERPSSVVLKAQILGGASFVLDCGGLLARAIQHELDHLEGILFIQRVAPDDLEPVKSKLERLLKKSGRRNFSLKRIVN